MLVTPEVSKVRAMVSQTIGGILLIILAYNQYSKCRSSRRAIAAMTNKADYIG